MIYNTGKTMLSYQLLGDSDIMYFLNKNIWKQELTHSIE